MKKTWMSVLALMMALMVFCAACGGSGDKGPEESPEATELPSVTPPPKGEEDATNMVGANANSNGLAAIGMDRETWLASLSEEQRMVEEELIGKPVEDLYEAIGKPERSDYGTSCLVLSGKDGILYYDGFTVATTLFPSGEELVMGTAN